MFKLVAVLATVGFALLLIATGLLAWLNWSSRLYMPFITAALVGIATGFVSIISTLKASSQRDSFVSPVIIYRDIVGAPVVLPKSLAASRRIDLAVLLAQLDGDAVKTAKADAIFNTSLEAVQYAVFKII